jgi:Na+-transporting NADH:ubiquinone oxidoreductase subunit C
LSWPALPWVKTLQQEQRALDKQRNILAVAGLMQEG